MFRLTLSSLALCTMLAPAAFAQTTPGPMPEISPTEMTPRPAPASETRCGKGRQIMS